MLTKQNLIENKCKKNSNQIYIEDLESTLILSNEEKNHNHKQNISTIDSLSNSETNSSHQFLYKNIKSSYEFLENSTKKLSNDEVEKKFKTEICKNFKYSGFCKFGNNCSFAHGTNELRDSIRKNNLYKTKKCLSFLDGYCPYGFKCQYIHLKDDYNNSWNNLVLRLIPNYDINNSVDYDKILFNNSKFNNKRLKIFKKITNN